MARIFEYQGKQLLRKAGMKIPAGEVAGSPAEARKSAEKIGKPVAIKAQVWATGRFQAGGIKFADNAEDAFRKAEEVLGRKIKGQQVKNVLVEERLNVAHEYYAGIVIDSSMRVKAPVLVFSTEGGTGVEEVAARNPERVARQVIDPLSGLEPSAVGQDAEENGRPAAVQDKIKEAILGPLPGLQGE